MLCVLGCTAVKLEILLISLSSNIAVSVLQCLIVAVNLNALNALLNLACTPEAKSTSYIKNSYETCQVNILTNQFQSLTLHYV